MHSLIDIDAEQVISKEGVWEVVGGKVGKCSLGNSLELVENMVELAGQGGRE